jgi:hypothetical protein
LKAHHTWETELGDPMLEQATVLPADHPKLDDRILWDHSARTYLAWFDQGQEEFSTEEQELAEYYGKFGQVPKMDQKLTYCREAGSVYF